MNNRLHQHVRPAPNWVVLFFLAFSPLAVKGQQDAFNFSYPGPNTILLGPTCTQILQGNAGSPVVSSVNGSPLTVDTINVVLTGFDYDDPLVDGTYVIHWDVANQAGQSATYQFVITLEDQSPPVFNLLGVDPFLTFNSIAQVPPAPNIPVSDNCTPLALLNTTFVQTTPPAPCAGGVFTRTWTATDEASNTAVFTQTITIIEDILPPQVLVAPQNGSSPCASLSTAYPAWLNVQMAAFQASDPSGIASYTNNSPLPYPPGCAVNTTVTFTATDNCGLKTTATATFVTNDTQPPVVTDDANDVVAYCAPSGPPIPALSAWIQTHATTVASDACTPTNNLVWSMKINGNTVDSAGVVAAFLASFANGCSQQTIGGTMYPKVRGKVTVDFSVADACGLIAPAGQADFGAIDTIRPIVTGVTNTEQCGQNNDNQVLTNWINAHGNATVADECSGYTWTNFSWTTSLGATGNGQFNTGPYPVVPANNCNWHVDVTFRATDDCGNIGSGTIRFEIRDTIKPVFTGLAPVALHYCPAPLPVLPNAVVSDNCDNAVSIGYTRDTLEVVCDGSYNLEVVWTATDDCGNSRSAVQILQVRDTTSPFFTLFPPTINLTCDNVVIPPALTLGNGIDADDACGSITNLLSVIISQQDPNPAVCGHYTYNFLRTYTAVDACGNTKNVVQTIAVKDVEPPVFTGFTSTTAICETSPVFPPPTAADVCSGPTPTPVLVSDVITGGPCDDSYTRTLTYQAADVCGNVGTFIRQIFFEDTIRPQLSGIPGDVFVDCDAIPAPPAPGFITGTDNCDESVNIVLVQNEIRNPDATGCDHWANYMIVRTWTVNDNCGNTRSYTQAISVQDNTGPYLEMPDTISLPNETGLCGANVLIPPPVSLYDLCSSLQRNIVLNDTVVLVASGVPADQVPVDTVVFQWMVPAGPPLNPVTGTPVFTVFLDNADSEIASESFTILGEDDVVLGITNPTATGCGNGSTQVNIPSSLLNQWLTDGELVLRLAPNSQGANACNAICPGGRARGSLQYFLADQQVPITLTYSLDGAPMAMYPPPASVFLDAGEHQVSYVATDCAGNSTTASVVLNIDDIEPPAIAALPNMTAYVGAVGCTAAVSLPFPAITDNCGVSGSINKASASVMVKFVSNPNITDPVPTNTLLSVTGLIPNAVGNGVLRILNMGDNGETGEFFRIYDENNQFLGATDIGSVAGQCTAVNQTVIAVHASAINQWAAGNGVANLEARANTDVLNFTNFVSPCGPLTNQSDGISTLQAVLEYSYAVVNYEILQNNMVIQSALLTGAQTTVNLPPGQYTVRYTVPDANGTEGMVSFNLTVLDTVPPQAKCLSTTIFTNPSGVVNYTLLASEINNGSNDNCSPTVDLQVTPSIFNCNMAVGQQNPYTVTLTVTDSSGKSSTCTALVRVETQTFQPTASQGVCEGGSIQLMANPPSAPGNNAYTYKWSGPASYLSTVANPVLNNVNLSVEGTYTVTITGFTGCTAIGMTQIDLITLPMPSISAGTQTPCEGNSFLLSTPPFVGSGVSYQWYSGSPGMATLMATTALPQYTVPAQPVGSYTYYVQIVGNGCSSEPSSLVNITVQARPPAVVDQSMISVCEGSPIVFGTPLTGYSYSWTGPSGYNSMLQYPPAIPSAQEIHEGPYTLIVSQNGCQSLPATVTVTVNQKPPMPLLSGTAAVCEGDMAQLTCSFPPTTGEYFWVSPQLITASTTINTLVLPAATVLDSGLWRVYIVQGGCQSDVSIPFLLDVDKRPEVMASYNTPLCQGSLLQLTASANMSGLFFSWSGPNTFTSLQQNPVTNGTTGTYTVIAQTSIGCKDTASVDVLMVSLPLVNVTNNAQNCSGGMQDVQLQSTVTTPYTPVTYFWSGPSPYTSTLANPIIPDVTALNNGDYTLVVTDAFGCMSLPATTTINVENNPVQPTITSPDAVLCVGESTVLQVPTGYNQGVNYIWNTPLGGQTVTTVPVLPLNNASLLMAGNYTVVVETENCESLPSSVFTVQVLAAPAQPVATASPDSVCAGSPLQLSTPFVAGATYQWVGPCSYSSNQQNPIINPTGSCTAGAYSVAVTVNGCTSPESESVLVVLKPVPPTPVPLSTNNVCLDSDDTLFLRINNTPTQPLAQYTWYNALNNQVMGPSTYALTYPVTNLSNIQPGVNSFYVVASLNGCNSMNSPSVQVTFDTVPDNSAFAGVDFTACASQTLALNAQLPGGNVTGRWVQVSGTPVTFVNPANPQTTIQGAVAGNTYQFKWILSNGACKNYSNDIVAVQVVASEAAQSIAFLDICAGTSMALSATQGQSSQGMWTQLPGQAQLGVAIENPSDPNTMVTGMTPGNTYFFYWTLPDIGCGPTTSTTLVQSYSPKPQAGANQFICSTDNCAILAAEVIPTGETSAWSSDDPQLVFTNPNNINTSVCGLQPGDNLIIFTTNGGRCGDQSRDSLIINFEPTPIARPDTVYVPNAVRKTFDVLLNDDLPNAYSVTVVEQPVHGTLEDMSDGVYSYLPNITYAGQDQFRYKICNLNCPDACSFAVVTFYVNEPGDCVIPTLFTPNNDGVNDIFVVPCLGTDGRLDNEVSIFNQWGDEVFHAQPYNNDWDGTYNGEQLPAGTYYYVVKFNAGGGIKTGFLVLQR